MARLSLFSLVALLATLFVAQAYALDVNEMNELASLERRDLLTIRSRSCMQESTLDASRIEGHPQVQPNQTEFMVDWCNKTCTASDCPFLSLVAKVPESNTTSYVCSCKGNSSSNSTETPAPTSGATMQESSALSIAAVLASVVVVAVAQF